MDGPLAGGVSGLGCALIWAATSFLWAAVGREARPVAITAFKAVLGSLAFTAVVAAGTGRVWPTTVAASTQGLLALSGVIGLAAGDLCFFVALMALGPRRALLLHLLAAPLAALLAAPTLREHIGLAGWLGIGGTLAGVAWVQAERVPPRAPGRSQLPAWLGVAAGVGGGLGQAVSSLLTKAALREGVALPEVLQIRLVAAAAALLVTGLVSFRLVAWAAPFGRGVTLGRAVLASLGGTVVGLVLMTHSQGAIPVGLSNALTSTAPLWSVPLAIVLRDERVSARAVLGTVVAVGGVALVLAT